eukprot:scaffold88141_cov24-Prasinocladus_malaysianus.AAC.2
MGTWTRSGRQLAGGHAELGGWTLGVKPAHNNSHPPASNGWSSIRQPDSSTRRPFAFRQISVESKEQI